MDAGGTVKLASTNPFDKPIIDPQYLTTDFDIFTMREAVKAVIRFSQASAWSDYIVGPFSSAFQAAANATDDSIIDQYVRETTTTIFHPVGTASMGPFNSPNGVVGPDLRVKGATGLRIVDASVFVSTVNYTSIFESANTQITRARHRRSSRAAIPRVQYIFSQRGLLI